MILVETNPLKPSYILYEFYKDKIEKFNLSCQSSSDVILKFDDCVSLALADDIKIKPLILDFTDKKLVFRLNNLAKSKEALIRAVSLSKIKEPFIIDATAGLGRDSFILQAAFNNVLMFERNVAVYCLLKDALERLNKDNVFKFNPPILHPLGTIMDYTGLSPDVIYYDPMFPHRDKSAKVKKEMQIFQSLIGHDEDIEKTLAYAISLAKYKVVLKRPKNAEIIDIEGAILHNQTDGGVCRFDSYVKK